MAADRRKRLVSAGLMVDVVGDALRQLRQEMHAETQAAISKALDERGSMTYKGTWDDGASYSRGSAVTVGGSLWIATAPTERGERPGKAASWRLAVKSGQR